MMIMTDPELFTQRCQVKGLSQNGVARHIGLAHSYLSLVRSGERRIHETDAKAIARLLGVAVSRLFVTAPPTRRPRRTTREAQQWDWHGGFADDDDSASGSHARSSSARSKRAASTPEPASASTTRRAG